MVWTAADTLALARSGCALCAGVGLISGRPCPCVLREIFRACHRRFTDCARRHVPHRASMEPRGSSRLTVWGLKDQEYVADFCLVARRVLSPSDHRLFRYRYLLAADFRSCAQVLGEPRAAIMNRAYRLEAVLGRAFRELAPYPLFPLDEYFAGPLRGSHSIDPAPVARAGALPPHLSFPRPDSGRL